MASKNSAQNRLIVGTLIVMIVVLGVVLLWSIGTGQFEYKADEVQLPTNTNTSTPISPQ